MPEVMIATAALAGLILFFLWRARRSRQRLLDSIRIVTLPYISSAALGNQRTIYVYLPPGYHQNTLLHYNTLYLNDGQEREAIGLRETLARLSASGKITPIITVAIPTNDDRLQEYGTACSPNGRGLGLKAAAYSKFIVEELKPLIDRQFRTRSPAAFVGVSLGGLSAFDIVWNHPEAFSTVGVMSGSFWWHTANAGDWGEGDPRIAHTLIRQSTHHPGFRGWFQAGSRDEVCDRDQDGVIDAIQDTLELIDALTMLGYQCDVDLKYVEVTGGRHDYETWARVLPEFLMWAFNPRSPQPEEKSSNDSRLPR